MPRVISSWCGKASARTLARIFTPSAIPAGGAAEGSEFLVSSVTTNFEMNPSVAMDANGDFVVAWQSYRYSSNDGYGDITDI